MKLSEWIEQQPGHSAFTVHAKGLLNDPAFKYSICVTPQGYSGHIHFHANELDPELPEKFFTELKAQKEIFDRVRLTPCLIKPVIKGM